MWSGIHFRCTGRAHRANSYIQEQRLRTCYSTVKSCMTPSSPTLTSCLSEGEQQMPYSGIWLSLQLNMSPFLSCLPSIMIKPVSSSATATFRLVPNTYAVVTVDRLPILCQKVFSPAGLHCPPSLSDVYLANTHFSMIPFSVQAKRTPFLGDAIQARQSSCRCAQPNDVFVKLLRDGPLSPDGVTSQTFTTAGLASSTVKTTTLSSLRPSAATEAHLR
mmetsp:Transcript_2959/g.9064  ORF Transcript_2959/g.9064 Transcript_2959/m.9064 type:complete len:218 (-) Transcript_2959:434-1087(-)